MYFNYYDCNIVLDDKYNEDRQGLYGHTNIVNINNIIIHYMHLFKSS